MPKLLQAAWPHSYFTSNQQQTRSQPGDDTASSRKYGSWKEGLPKGNYQEGH